MPMLSRILIEVSTLSALALQCIMRKNCVPSRNGLKCSAAVELTYLCLHVPAGSISSVQAPEDSNVPWGVIAGSILAPAVSSILSRAVASPGLAASSTTNAATLLSDMLEEGELIACSTPMQGCSIHVFDTHTTKHCVIISCEVAITAQWAAISRPQCLSL